MSQLGKLDLDIPLASFMLLLNSNHYPESTQMVNEEIEFAIQQLSYLADLYESS